MKKYRVPVTIGGAIRVAEEDAETDILNVMIPENREAYASKYIGNVVVNADSAVNARDRVFHAMASAVYEDTDDPNKVVAYPKWVYICGKAFNFDRKQYWMDLGKSNNLSVKRHQMLVGQMSNLITDMIIGGATNDEFIDAIQHSMVVLDAVKYNLDYKRSAEDHHIKELLAKYRKVKK